MCFFNSLIACIFVVLGQASQTGEMRNHAEEESQFQLEYTDDFHQAQMLSALNTMRKNRHFCDVILHVCALTVKHHILQAPLNSDEFYILFRYNFVSFDFCLESLLTGARVKLVLFTVSYTTGCSLLNIIEI